MSFRKIITGVLILALYPQAYCQFSWTQKANFPGAARDLAAAFSIGNYGYIGCGYDGSYLNDFYKWDQNTNTWSAIASYPGPGSWSPTSCSINGYGYVGLGQTSSNTMATDWWRYDSASNTWTAMASFPTTGWYDASCFVIGHKCWVVCGSNGGPPYNPSVWMYDANANTWTQKANFPGGQLEGLVAFAIGKTGYAGGGWDGGSFHSAMYRYDTATDTWTPIASIPARPPGLGGDPRNFVIGSRAYVCLGRDGTNKAMPTGLSYDTVTQAWCQFSRLGLIARAYGAAFVINNKGYMGVGADTNGYFLGPYVNTFYEYNPRSTFTVSDTASCSSDTVHFAGITYYDSTDMSVSWDWTFTGGSPFSSGLQYPSVAYSTPGTYQVELIISSCAGTDTVIRNIHVSGGQMALSISGNTAICLGQSDTLRATGGGTYLWSNGSTTSSIIVTPSADSTFTVHVQSGPCQGDTSITVSVGVKLPVTINGTTPVCAGSPVTLTSTGGSYYTYQWNTGATTSSITVTPYINTSYSVVVNNGVCSGDTSFTIAVNPLPTVTILASEDSLCTGETSTINATGGGTYLWSNGSTNASISVTPASTTTYTLGVTLGACTKDTSITIIVNTIPVAVASAGQSTCEGTAVTLTASGGQRYKWLPGGDLSCDTCAATLANPAVNTTYTLVAYNGNCTDTANTTVTVIPAPTGVACCGDTIQMGDTVMLTVEGSGDAGYQWIPSSSLQCDTCSDTKAFPQFTTTYSVVMTDSDGCRRTDSVRIFVEGCSTVWIPNAFTPNGDDLNNVFAPEGVCMAGYTMYIFNRWGQLIYHTADSKPWNGTYKNGNIVEEDTYIYVITETDGFRKQHQYIGRVTLLK